MPADGEVSGHAHEAGCKALRAWDHAPAGDGLSRACLCWEGLVARGADKQNGHQGKEGQSQMMDARRDGAAAAANGLGGDVGWAWQVVGQVGDTEGHGGGREVRPAPPGSWSTGAWQHRNTPVGPLRAASLLGQAVGAGCSKCQRMWRQLAGTKARASERVLPCSSDGCPGPGSGKVGPEGQHLRHGQAKGLSEVESAVHCTAGPWVGPPGPARGEHLPPDLCPVAVCPAEHTGTRLLAGR